MTERFNPEVLQVEIATGCNYRCALCNYVTIMQDRRPGQLMSPERYREVIGRSFEPPYMVIFSGFSETLLHPEFASFVRFEKERGNMVLLATNGALLDHKRRSEMLDAGVDAVTVSLEALDAETYARLRAGGDFAKVREQLAAFQQEIEAARARTGLLINYVVTRSTAATILPFMDWMAGAGLRELALIRIMNPGVDNAFFAEEDLSPEDYAAIDFATIERRGRELGVKVFWSDPHHGGHKACGLPHRGVYLSASFELSVCPYAFFETGYIFGNLAEESFDSIRAKPEYRAFREACAEGRYPAFCGEGCACYFTSEAGGA